MQTSLLGIAKKARSDKRCRFRNLYRELNEELLRDSWQLIRKDAALGVDRVSAAEYEANLEENIHQLVERLKRKRYRARLVRRHYIPKGEGRMRPLGIPAIEDKLLQLAVKRLLEAIYEQDFLPCSYGYRPRVGALEAVFVCGCEREEDAQRFYGELEERLRKFGLELAAEKTRVIPFSRYRRGETSFDFLGFEFRWGTDRKRQARLKRRTARKKFRSSVKRVAEWCKKNRHLRMKEQFRRLNAKLRGYYNYYGVNGNYASLNEFYHLLQRLHLKWLNRRSQCPSYTWDGYYALRQHFALARPHIVGRPKSCLVTVRG